MKYLLPNLLVILFTISGTSAFSQSELFSYETYNNAEGETLKYRQLMTDYDSKSKYPLVIFLHGSGERGDDNEAQLKWGVLSFANNEVMKNYRPIVIAPQCPQDMTWDNISFETMSMKPEPTKPMKLLIELIKQTKENLPVDTNRIYITGHSMGGFGTFDAISRYPDLFAAAVPICGGGDISKVPAFSHIPLWIFHGALDDVVDPALSHNMVEALTKEGAHPGFTQYPEAGHFSWVATYSDMMMMNWLFSKSK